MSGTLGKPGYLLQLLGSQIPPRRVRADRAPGSVPEAAGQNGNPLIGRNSSLIKESEPQQAALKLCKISSFQSIKVEGEGKVLREPAKTSYKPNDVVRLTAVPDEDWVFSEWQGGLSGTDETGSIVMTKDLTVTAFFETGVGKVRGYVSDGRGGPAVKGAVVKWPEKASYHR